MHDYLNNIFGYKEYSHHLLLNFNDIHISGQFHMISIE